MPDRICCPTYYCARRLLLLVACLSVGVWFPSCQSSSEPDATHNDAGSFRIEAPATAAVDESFNIRVTALDSSGGTSEDFAGSVILAASAGSITPESIDLIDGEAAISVRLTGAVGAIEIMADTDDGAAGKSTAIQVATGSLSGDPKAPASENITPLQHVADPDDFSDEVFGLEGVPISFRTFLVLVAPDATVESVNQGLELIGADVAGGAPGGGAGGGFLVVRVPSATVSDLENLYAQIDSANWTSLVSRDAALGEELEPRTNFSPATTWAWESSPMGGNWGMELIRCPQLWNLNGAVSKTGRRVRVNVIDSGFRDGHPDLAYFRRFGSRNREHGTHVAGIVAATWNGSGVDGLCPFADIVASQSGWAGHSGTGLEINTAYGELISSTLLSALEGSNQTQVVNMSLGYPKVIDTNASTAMQDLASEQGEFLARVMDTNGSLGDAMVVVAAGNESNDGFGLQEAKWASPMCNAALEHGVARILVVESVAGDNALAGGATRSDFSNVGGHISAPGSSVLSTSISPNYETKSGTSMSAPHVTGLVAYLLALAPDLTHQQIQDVLINSSVAVEAPECANRIDAFAAAMEVDFVRSSNTVLRMLLDIDDGSLDGNQRADVDGQIITSEDLDADGGIGDGRIDMSDFRRFRDWLHQVNDTNDLFLDGGANHIKRDVDGDLGVEDAANENTYPRGDFNGDGKLSRTETAYVGGSVSNIVTDLEVLQLAFQDPNHSAAELPNLLDSADLVIDGSAFLNAPGVTTVRTVVHRIDDNAVVAERVHTANRPVEILTVPILDDGYELTTTGTDVDLTTLAEVSESFNPLLCDDNHWKPSPVPIIEVNIVAPEQTNVDSDFPIVIRAGLLAIGQPIEYEAGLSLDITAIGGTLSTEVGQTDSDGFFSLEGRLTNSSPMTIFVTASHPETEDITVPATIRPIGSTSEFRLIAGELRTRASGDGRGCDETFYDNDDGEVDIVDFDLASRTGSAESVGTCPGGQSGGTGKGTSVIDADLSRDATTGTITLSARGRTSVTGSSFGPNNDAFGRGYASTTYYLEFEIESGGDGLTGAGYRFEIDGSMNASATGESSRGNASMYLRGAGFNISAAASILDGGGGGTPTASINETGVLPPGRYTLGINSSSSGTARARGPVAISGDGDYDIVMTFTPE